ncbi:LPXTG cell wall anchor domain-containing protein [Streptomyces fildesensis]|uniref:LPXTG cell wall anchor domain-containing protein n=1 Tax=Streptomyces fildesensis TaxID=375757 RepID=A0ABW8CIG7_9ACTN
MSLSLRRLAVAALAGGTLAASSLIWAGGALAAPGPVVSVGQPDEYGRPAAGLTGGVIAVPVSVKDAPGPGTTWVSFSQATPGGEPEHRLAGLPQGVKVVVPAGCTKDASSGTEPDSFLCVTAAGDQTFAFGLDVAATVPDSTWVLPQANYGSTGGGAESDPSFGMVRLFSGDSAATLTHSGLRDVQPGKSVVYTTKLRASQAGSVYESMNFSVGRDQGDWGLPSWAHLKVSASSAGASCRALTPAEANGTPLVSSCDLPVGGDVTLTETLTVDAKAPVGARFALNSDYGSAYSGPGAAQASTGYDYIFVGHDLSTGPLSTISVGDISVPAGGSAAFPVTVNAVQDGSVLLDLGQRADKKHPAAHGLPAGVTVTPPAGSGCKAGTVPADPDVTCPVRKGRSTLTFTVRATAKASRSVQAVLTAMVVDPRFEHPQDLATGVVRIVDPRPTGTVPNGGVKPSASPATGGTELAETGGSGDTTGFALGGSALLAAGAAALVVARRRKARHS